MDIKIMDVKIREAKEFYKSLLTFTDSIFSLLTDTNKLELGSVQKQITLTLNIVRYDRNYIVYVLETAKQWINPHVSHAVRSCLIALIIGTDMKLPRHQLVELGVAGLLCNIGVLQLSGRIYTKSGGGFRLLKIGTEEEKKLLFVHPIHAHNVLKSFYFPPRICEAALHHHELEDGTGFPNGLKGDSICLYGKILSVAGYYEAFSIDHIDVAKNGHAGVINILKNKGSFDASVIRSLINSISVYPIGIYVLLSNGKRGQVIDIDPFDPRFPIVQIIGESSDKIVRTFEDISIIRVLNPEEA